MHLLWSLATPCGPDLWLACICDQSRCIRMRHRGMKRASKQTTQGRRVRGVPNGFWAAAWTQSYTLTKNGLDCVGREPEYESGPAPCAILLISSWQKVEGGVVQSGNSAAICTPHHWPCHPCLRPPTAVTHPRKTHLPSSVLRDVRSSCRIAVEIPAIIS